MKKKIIKYHFLTIFINKFSEKSAFMKKICKFSSFGKVRKCLCEIYGAAEELLQIMAREKYFHPVTTFSIVFCGKLQNSDEKSNESTAGFASKTFLQL